MLWLKSVTGVLATGNNFASLHVEYLLGETTVREIVRDCCNIIWNCLKATQMSEKTNDNWLNIRGVIYK